MKLTRLALAALAAAALAASPDAAFAGWSNDPGANFRFAPGPNDQWGQLATEDGAGGVFIVWSEVSDIRAQHVTAQGLIAPGWPANGVPVCTDPFAQYPSSIAPDGAGGFLVAWDDYRNGAADIYAQRIRADGTPHWTINGVPACAAAGEQWSARICSDRAGGAILAWWDLRTFGSTNYDVYAQRLSASGAALWSGTNGVAVSALAGSQQSPVLVSDGTVGGAYFAWSDYRTGGADVYAMRFDGTGAPRPGWTAGGTGVSADLWESWDPSIASDGAFGALIAWTDTRLGNADVYASRMTPQGTAAAGWPASGVALTLDVGYQDTPQVAADGAGGAVVSWSDFRAGNLDVYAQRVTAAGSPIWAVDGTPVCTAPGNQGSARVVSDGAGGAVVGWIDWRAGAEPMAYAQRVTGGGAIATGFAPDGNAIATAHWVQSLGVCSDGAGGAILTWQHNGVPQLGYAQRIDRWGYLGAQPRIASVRDVPGDQGGRVKLSWDPSPLDAYPDNAINAYTVYRSVPTHAALAALARGEAVLEDRMAGEAGAIAGRTAAAARGTRRELVTTSLAGATVYWEYLADVSASQLPGYSHLAATAQDSVAGANPRTLFMVRAQDWYSGRFWYSDPDSGYSTDDLAPAAPAPFTGEYAAGATHLHWQPNAEADLAGYRLYRGASAGFVPSPANLVASPPDTGHVDSGPAGYFYKLTAVDAHGNESPASLLTPSGTLAVEGGATWTLAFAPATPNPSSGATTCRFTLPGEGSVRMAVYDAAGRLVRTLADGPLAAGEHAIRWDGEREGGGRAPSGLYLARLSFAGRTLTQKLLRVR